LAAVAEVRVAFLGDVCGSPGRMVLRQQLPRLRQDHAVEVVIANGENAKAGSGLTPDLYRKIRDCGVDAVTLGDHVFRDMSIASVLETAGEPIARPANLPARAVGRSTIRLGPTDARRQSIIVVTVLGRIFFPIPADDPFATGDRILESLPEPDPIVIVEAHMEATSEKAALAHHLDGRVSLVVGTHTHVPTADARILRGGTGFITDLGMCGPYASVIGRDADAVVRYMTTGMPVPFTVARGGEAMCGVVARIDGGTRRTLSIERVQYPAEQGQPPFSEGGR
jgi:metallophosphoesterase (TIGR00282 family)